MEKNNVESTNTSGTFSKINTKNLKPFLSVFVILIIIIFGYYFFWRSVAIKMKNIIIDQLQDYQYESIEISGFPFTKRVTVNNISFSSGAFLVTQNEVKIQELEVSSFILSGNLDIKFKDASILDTLSNINYSLVYNEEPVINIGFYSNGDLKNFNYSDNGYRVITSDNKTLYTADKSVIKVESLLNGKTVDYSITGNLQNMQNVSIMKTDNSITETVVPDAYNADFDISSSITEENGELESSIIKINSFNVGGSEGDLSISGEVFKDKSDPFSSGNIKITLKNYQELLTSYKENVINALNIETVDLPEQEKQIYINMANSFFNIIQEVIKKNPSSTDELAVVDISRAKFSPDYIVNGETAMNIIQRVVDSQPKI